MSSSRNDGNIPSRHRRRRRRGSQKDSTASDYPNVKFDGYQSIDIPANAQQSPVDTRLSLLSNPKEFRFLDEIALLKRGQIDRDAPKHPYNRYSGHPQSSDSSTTSDSSQSVTSQSTTDSEDNKSITPMTTVSYLGGEVESETTQNIGNDGNLKVSKLKEGGIRYELASGKQLAIFQQNQGQSALIIYKN
ncbi:unnamed protein product [Caenorhabditis angaria]|uniref:Uncharacterized protein n=1 Tax=Caenorhabditis angaria TaxID=860376 RepID=A0A9P1IJQ6_9PELO|nr:unnamed protein product [Caenorhabditis angaria]